MKHPGLSHGLQWNWKVYLRMRILAVTLLLIPSVCSAGYPEFNRVNKMRPEGLFSYRYDPRLDQVARSRAHDMAVRGRGGHPPGSFRPGSHEGVSWGSGSTARPENACYSDGTRLRTAGASCEWSGGRYYCSVVYGGDTGSRRTRGRRLFWRRR